MIQMKIKPPGYFLAAGEPQRKAHTARAERAFSLCKREALTGASDAAEMAILELV